MSVVGRISVGAGKPFLPEAPSGSLRTAWEFVLQGLWPHPARPRQMLRTSRGMSGHNSWTKTVHVNLPQTLKVDGI